MHASQFETPPLYTDLSVQSCLSCSYLRAGGLGGEGLAEHQGCGVDGVRQLLLHQLMALSRLADPEEGRHGNNTVRILEPETHVLGKS